MRKCDYCGKANEKDAVLCLGCGTPLPTEEVEGQEVARIASTPVAPQLDARRATRIFAIVLGASMICGFLAAAVGALVFIAQGNDLRGEREARHFTRTMSDPIAVLMTVVAGVAMLRASRSLPREVLSDGSPVGAAWTIGPAKHIAQGLGFGTVTGLVIAILSEHQGRHGAYGAVMTLGALALAPPVEELLFRGLLYGGYRRSLGPVWAAGLTTFLFCLLHGTQMFRSGLYAVGMTGMALAALWFRLRSESIGPAVAVHLGHNAALTAVFLYFTR